MPDTYDLQSFEIRDVTDGVVTGLLKLAQRWSILFCTELGSMQFQPEIGCDFPQLLRNGELGSESAVRSAFVIAVQQIEGQLVQGTTPEEQLESVTLTNVTSDGSTLQLTVRFLSVAGESREVALPVRYNQVITV